MVFCMSFSGDSGWRGMCVVEEDGFIQAIQKSHALNINPGGRVEAIPIPSGYSIPDEWMHRLLTTREEVAEFDAVMGGDGVAVSVWL